MSGDAGETTSRTLLRRLVHVLILRPMLKAVFGVHVRGRENIAGQQQFVLIANHNSHLDIFLLFSLLTLDQLDRTHAVADKAYFARPRWLNRGVRFLFQPLWVERGVQAKQDDPFADFHAALDRGENLIVFPEGTRGDAGVIGRFRSGIGRLVAGHPGIPILPVFLKGPERALPKASAFPVPLSNVIAVGPPQELRDSGHREITRHLEQVLRELGTAVCRSHQRDRSRPRRGQDAIAILGIDGSGKSTISRAMAEALSDSESVCLISDTLQFYNNAHVRPLQPLGTNVFREAVNRAAKNAKSLKLYKIPKLTELLLRNQLYDEIQRWYAPDRIVMDGSPLLNLLAWVTLYRDEPLAEDTCLRLVNILTGTASPTFPTDPLFTEFPELKVFWLLKLNTLVLPETVILIDVDPDTACERISSRGEERQVHETVEKLARLRASYLGLMHSLATRMNVRTAIVNGNEPLEHVIEQTRRQLERST